MVYGWFMAQIPLHITPDRWLGQFLTSSEVAKGGVVKRQIRDIERIVGWEIFVEALRRRGFQAVRNGRHVIVFCNSEPIRRVV